MSRVQLLCVHMFLCISHFIVLNKFCSILLYIDSQSHDIHHTELIGPSEIW